MSTKGVIDKNIIRGDNYKFVIGGEEYTLIMIGELSEELRVVNLPDDTNASGGRSQAIESEITIAEHMAKERNYFEDWWDQCRDPIPPTAYRNPAIVKYNNEGNIGTTDELTNMFLTGRTSAELSLEDGAETMQVVTYKFSADSRDPG